MKLEFEDKIKNLIPHFGKTEKDVFTYKQLEQLLNFRPVLGQKRFVACGRSLEYTWKNSGWATDYNALPISVIKKIVSNQSCYIKDCNRASKEINLFCKKIEEILKCATDCHIYFSLVKDSQTFGKHFDKQHNTIVVSQGKIKCEIWTNNGVISKELSNGDYLFVPAYVNHMLTPLTEKRLSLSFASAPKETVHFEEREWLEI